jgi:hypothetical protein
MKIFKDDTWSGYFLAGLFVAALFLGGCAATMNYSSNPPADTSGPARVVPDDPKYKIVTP